MNRVPTIATVVRGAGVNIILKADQPTGRTVSGTVQDVLTRGNHPRGIKVRLTDGRVGRVQSHTGSQPASLSSSTASSSIVAAQVTSVMVCTDGDERQPPRCRQGRRHDEVVDLPQSQEVGLEAYIRPAKPKKGGRGRAAAGSAAVDSEEPTSNPTSEVVTCPVCGAFEGDASAVEHHVASHFD